MRIATWNVNGVRARERNVKTWLEREKPDLLLMQEIKCEAASFPACFAEAGYHAEIVGQKGFNGVAILSRAPVEVTHRRLPGLPEDDAQARYIEVRTESGLRVGNLYLPNGNSNGETGYAYKLAWMDPPGRPRRGTAGRRCAAGAGGGLQCLPRGCGLCPGRARQR